MAITKVRQTTSVKICKKEKKEFNSLIGLLKPKVYITDCFSFKRLVQDLTGNGSSNISITTSSLHLEKQHEVLVEEEVAVAHNVDVSTDASFDSSELYNPEVLINDQELQQFCDQMYADYTTATLEGTVSTEEQLVNMLPIRDLESWLLGGEPFDPFNNGYYGQILQDFSVYEYELLGLV